MSFLHIGILKSSEIVELYSETNLRCCMLQTCHAEAAKASLDAGEPDREAWMRLCRAFLKGKLVLS